MDDVGLLDESLEVTGTQASIHKGFPNAAAEQSGRALSLDRLLIRHRASTYLFRIKGHDWESIGIFDNDIAIIDRSLAITQHAIVIGWSETGEFYIGRSQSEHISRVWGVVTSTIHPLSK